MINFNFDDSRYSRQLAMPEWGLDRQKLLSKSNVAVIGAGGVKTTLLTALTAAGVGQITIFEFDTIELSNLNRQTLFTTKDIGKSKGEIAVRRLRAINPDISINWVNAMIETDNIGKLLNGFDFIVEGGDSPAGRNLVNTYCLDSGTPYTHASAQFNYGYCFTVVPKLKTACFACFFPNDYKRIKSTGAVPVSALSTQIAGSIGANEVIKYLIGYQKNLLTNKMLRFSSLFLSEKFSIEKQKRDKDCPICSKYYL